MTLWLALGAGLALGASSAPHCFAMCGPLASFAAGTEASSRRGRIARHQLGRLVAYATLGAIAATAGALVAHAIAPRWASIVLGALLAAGMLVMAAQLSGLRPPVSRLVAIRRSSTTPLATRVLSVLPRDPMLVGAISALLPCGALYGALLLASGMGSASLGVASMTAFAVASGVGLVAASSFAARARSMRSRRVLAACLVAGAALVVARPVTAAMQPQELTSCVCGAR